MSKEPSRRFKKSLICPCICREQTQRAFQLNTTCKIIGTAHKSLQRGQKYCSIVPTDLTDASLAGQVKIQKEKRKVQYILLHMVGFNFKGKHFQRRGALMSCLIVLNGHRIVWIFCADSSFMPLKAIFKSHFLLFPHKSLHQGIQGNI